MNRLTAIKSVVMKNSNKIKVIDIIDPTNLILYYRFSTQDVSGTSVATWATGIPVFDAVMTGTTNIVNNQLPTLTSGTGKNGIIINRSI